MLLLDTSFLIEFENELASEHPGPASALLAARRTVPAAISIVTPRAAMGGMWALTFLSLAYAGILFQQPNTSAVCLDIGGNHAGAVLGFVNNAGNLAAAGFSVVFGYLVAYSGSYNAPYSSNVGAAVCGDRTVGEVRSYTSGRQRAATRRQPATTHECKR